MTTILHLKQHDTAPDLVANLTDGGAPVDLTTAVHVRVLAQHDTDLNTHFAREVTGSTVDGKVTMNWEPEDTAVPGLLNIEYEIEWPDGTIQSFPGSGYLKVVIESDLG